ncbi:LAETG motif-containing sortase-dependent surface protein [Streptomyces sp. NPDC046977]|uniref:LAETG motif-containing sortase-dependent surface protein n=1 Tax=Streptomyces sp. NPDC046977 TaxID=3154703 RepID=UPI0033EDB2CA
MNLRHALTSVAVTAAMAPAVVFTGSAAVAAPGTPSPGETTATATPGATVTPTTEAATTTASGTSTIEASSCTGRHSDIIDKELVAALHGIPDGIAAGSGWHEFTLDVDNHSGNSYPRVQFLVIAAQLLDMTWGVRETTGAALQFQDPSSGRWTTIPLPTNRSADDPEVGFVGYRAIKPHQSFSIKLRVSIASFVDPSIYTYYVVAYGAYLNSAGACTTLGGSPQEKDISILEYRPVPSKSASAPVPSKSASAGSGDLAETGSSSALPLIAAIGAAAVAVGAGGIVVVRRRKAGGHTA